MDAESVGAQSSVCSQLVDSRFGAEPVTVRSVGLHCESVITHEGRGKINMWDPSVLRLPAWVHSAPVGGVAAVRGASGG